MLQIQVQGLRELRRALAEFSDRRFAAAVATGLTRTAVQVRQAVQAEAQRALDRPTPYTLRQLRYVGATAQRLVAGVGFNIEAVTDARGVVTRYVDAGAGNTPAGKYLPPNISGGVRAPKRFEVALRRAGILPPGWFAVPGEGAPLDAYGNVSAGLVRQVLSQLRIEPTSGATSALPSLSAADRAMLARSGGRPLSPQQRSALADARARRNRIVAAQQRAGGQFFVVQRGARSRLLPGIYQRELVGRDIKPVFVFVPAVRYAARFDFDRVARAQADRLATTNIRTAIAEQLQRLRARNGT